MLDQREAISYLLRNELLDREDLVARGLSVTDASRRHSNFKVTSGGPGYLIKQGVGEGKAAAVAHEATVYRFLGRAGGPLLRCVPRVHAYDHEARVLVLELIEDAQNLREYHQQHGRFSILLARAMGKAVAALHRLPIGRRDGVLDTLPTAQPPWAFSLPLPPLGLIEECSSANLQLIKTIQAHPGFGEALDVLRQDWCIDGVVHGDLRWDNFIVFGKSPAGRKTRVKVIDWELAGLGDRCWDVGAVFSDYLSFWLLSIPLTEELDLHELLGLARYPLEDMLPALHAFWKSYANEMGFEAEQADRRLLKAVRYGASRLLQTAFEQMRTSIQLTGNVLCFLQLSLNILERPREATMRLLRIPLKAPYRP